ncbi:MAG: RNA pyrophosphohydrolase [Robiginitomaculum sp.]
MPNPAGPLSDYRPCAGIALFNQRGQVWLGRRSGAAAQHCWQLPQGGIDPGETFEHCAIRELEEETGVSVNLLSPLGAIDDWLCYDIPGGQKRDGHKWRGQKQKWFAFRFHGADSDFNLNRHLPAEFSGFRWAGLEEAAALIVPFKRKVYARIAQDFARFEGG